MTVGRPAAVFARKYRRSSFPTRRSCLPLSISDICGTRHLARTRPPSRSSTIILRLRGHPAAAAPDQAGVHGDGVRTARQILASELEKEFRAISRPADVRVVRGTVLPRSCAAARAFHATRRSSISPSAPTRRAGRMRTSECSPTFTPRRMLPCLGCRASPRLWSGRRHDDVHRQPRSQHRRRGPRLLNGAPPGSIKVAPQSQVNRFRLARVRAMGYRGEPVGG